jgi:hypothetical protein
MIVIIPKAAPAIWTPWPHRHCERSETIQTVSAERRWIASLRSQ